MKIQSRFVIAILALVCAACDDELFCGTTEVHRFASTSAALDVVVSVVNCGATTDYVTRVSLGSHGAPISKTADVVRLDSNHGDVGLGMSDDIPVDVIWDDDHTVVLSFPGKTRFFGFDSDVYGVRVKRK